jgi:hypothetical protein
MSRLSSATLSVSSFAFLFDAGLFVEAPAFDFAEHALAGELSLQDRERLSEVAAVDFDLDRPQLFWWFR